MGRTPGSKNKRYISTQDQRGTKCTSEIWCTPLPVNSPRAHCTVCHNTFDGVTKFDNHRHEGRCQDPASLGFELRNGYWSTKEGHDTDDRHRERLEAARAAKRG